MKTLVLLIGSLLFLSSSVIAQELSENIRVPEWVEFQSTQEKLVEQQGKILGDLTEIRQTMRQININLLGWQDVKNQLAAGKEVHCDAFKSKYDPRVEATVIFFALVGVLLLFNGGFNFFKNLFKKSEPKTT